MHIQQWLQDILSRDLGCYQQVNCTTLNLRDLHSQQQSSSNHLSLAKILMMHQYKVLILLSLTSLLHTSVSTNKESNTISQKDQKQLISHQRNAVNT